MFLASLFVFQRYVWLLFIIKEAIVWHGSESAAASESAATNDNNKENRGIKTAATRCRCRRHHTAAVCFDTPDTGGTGLSSKGGGEIIAIQE
jgi:hypothetical protein